MSYTVARFKRDLCFFDHAPHVYAVVQGPVLCLYVLEPSLWQHPERALQHYEFLRESLRDFVLQMKSCGACLQLAVGELSDVLSRLHYRQPFSLLVSHEETASGAVYACDLAVARWRRNRGVQWQEWPQHCVVRRLRSRDHWLGLWQKQIQGACSPAPLPVSLQSVSLPWHDIHWGQMQMQAGTTGVNVIRVYSLLKQTQGHDPYGMFVSPWLHGLRRIPEAWLFEPWQMPPDLQTRDGVYVGEDIPLPVAPLDRATKVAKTRIHMVCAQTSVRKAKAVVAEKHCSRSPTYLRNQVSPQVSAHLQRCFDC